MIFTQGEKMKKPFLIAGIIAAAALLCSCSSDSTATISVMSVYTNDMVYSEEGEADESAEEPVPEIFTVKKNDVIFYELITIKSAGKNSVKLKTAMEFYDPVTNDPSDTFVLKRGETLGLTEYGLLDATHTLYIQYAE